MIESTLATFGAAFGLTLAYTLVPGPVTVEALRRGVRRGARAVVSVRLGSLGGSLVWAAAGLTGAGVAVQSPPARVLLGVAGTAILLLLAPRRPRPVSVTVAPGRGVSAYHGDMVAGALLGLSSPMEAAFWLGAGSVVLAGSTGVEQITRLSAFVTGYIAAKVLVAVALAVVVSRGRCLAGDRVARAANLLCVITLAWFAICPLIRATAG